MELLKKREIKTDQSSIGGFYINGAFECYGLEPKDRGLTSTMSVAEIEKIKVPKKTAVPTGRYRVEKYFSPEHNCFVPRVVGVPGFDYTEIHKGNFPEDTEACLLLGTQYSAKHPDFIGDSKTAIDAFYSKIFPVLDKGEAVYITYE